MPVDRGATLRQAEKLLRQGKLEGAIAEYVRLVADQPRDWTSINALGDLYVRAGDLDRATAQFTSVADFMFAEGFLPKAAALYKKALRVKPDHEHTLRQLAEIAVRQGLLVDARNYLQQLEGQRRGRGADPGVLLAVGRMELLAGREAEARTAFTRLLGAAPSHHAALLDLAGELARAGSVTAAFVCADVVADDALLAGDWDRAIGALELLVRHAPHVPALVKLVEVAVDAARQDAMQSAQAQLADVYMADGRADEARVIAEDLFARNPQSSVHAGRLRRALSLAGVDDAERIIERYRQPADDLSDALTLDEVLPVPAPPAEVPAGRTADADDEVTFELLEIDLSDALADLGAPPADAGTYRDVRERIELLSRARAGKA